MDVLHQIQPQIPDLFLKLLTWAIGGTFSAAIIAIGFTWRASAKVTKFDDALKAHETATQTHAEKDEREFSLIAKAIDKQSEAIQKIDDKTYQMNNSLQQLLASSKVQWESIDNRFDDMAEQIKELRK